jgi:hypothetical protein
MVNTAPSMDLSEPVVRPGIRGDALLLAELGARTFRESSPHTPHEDLESYLKENFTCEKLFAYLSVKSAAALILEKSGQADWICSSVSWSGTESVSASPFDPT